MNRSYIGKFRESSESGNSIQTAYAMAKLSESDGSL